MIARLMLRRAFNEIPGNSGAAFVVDRALLRMQIADRGIRGHHALAHRLERLAQPAALEVMPECAQAQQLVLRGRKLAALLVGLGRRGLQPLVDVGEARVFFSVSHSALCRAASLASCWRVRSVVNCASC